MWVRVQYEKKKVSHFAANHLVKAFEISECCCWNEFRWWSQVFAFVQTEGIQLCFPWSCMHNPVFSVLIDLLFHGGWRLWGQPSEGLPVVPVAADLNTDHHDWCPFNKYMNHAMRWCCFWQDIYYVILVKVNDVTLHLAKLNPPLGALHILTTWGHKQTSN